jgi:hypothetical protein
MTDTAIPHRSDAARAAANADATTDCCAWKGVIGTALVRFVVPAWLLAGALFKLFSLDPRLLPKPVFELVKSVANGIGADFGPFLMLSYRSMVGVELILVGVMLLVPKLARSAAIFILSVFVVVLLAEMWGIYQGRDFAQKGFSAFLEPCGCFGSASPPALLTFLIDAALLAGVIIFRPGRLGRTMPGYPVSAIALVASIVVGTGLAFGKQQKAIELPADFGHDIAIADEPAAPAAEPTLVVDEVRPWPPAPAKLKPTYFINEKRALGQRLDAQDVALIISRPLPEDINRGRWHLVFYRKDCDHCFEILNKHFSGTLPAPTLAVEIPDSKGRPYPMPCKECRQHTLAKGPDYVLPAPLVMTVMDGVIVGISKDVDKPGAVEAVLAAGLPGAKAVDGALILETAVAPPATAPATAPPAPAAAAPSFPAPPSRLEAFYAPEFEKWVGQRFDAQPFALLMRRPLPIDPNRGSVCIVYYREDCEHCHQLLQDHFANELPMPTIAVAIPDSDPRNALEMPCERCARATLVQGPTYVVETPVLIVLKEGIVQCVLVGRGVDDPAAVDACLGR